MTYSNKTTLNFSGGEVSPGLVARTDIPLFNKVLSRMENFIAEPFGPAVYRQGTRYVHPTRRNSAGVFIPFQFSDTQAYLLEATEGYFRFYKDEAIILNSTTKAITGITKANPAVVTAVGHGYITGQEVYITGIVGMTEVNDRFFYITKLTADTFSLQDVFGNNVSSTGYTVYSSAGTSANVYEVKTPYLEADLETIKFDQSADTMYLAHRNYEPRQLTRSAHDSWALVRFSRTADPFATENDSFGTITAITLASPGVISDAGHTFVVGDHVYITGIVGTVELNDQHFLINATGSGNYSLKGYPTGAAVDTTAYTAWSSGGKVEKIGATSYPGAVGFTSDSRLGFAGTTAKPETFWLSKGPSAAGAVQFTNFTTGTAATDAVISTLAPLNGKVDSIRWLSNTDKYIAVGTFGSIRRLFGAAEASPVIPTAITAKSTNSQGVYSTPPLLEDGVSFYVSRSGLSVETIEYNLQQDGYQPDDKNLVSQHLTAAGVKQLVRQGGKPTLIWALRNDGVLLALTFKAKENIAGWHRHTLGGGDAAVESLGIMPRENNQDQLWAIVRRTVNGNTVRYVEFLTDAPVYPDPLDFYLDENNEAADLERFYNYQNEVAKRAIHLDASLTYDGSAYGTDANASLLMGGDAGIQGATGITATASAAVFTVAMVGRELWGAYTNEGLGGGRMEITGFTSSTVVTGTILDSFYETGLYNAGDWFLTATTVSGLDHLEGETVGLVTDGAVPDDAIVEDGTVEITQPASMIHVGLRYRGILQTLPLDQGGASGPAQNKPKNIAKVAVRFINSAGVQFGSSPYRLTQIEFRRGNDVTDRAVPLFTGSDESSYEDMTENDKVLILIQDQPLPCQIASIDVFCETSDE